MSRKTEAVGLSFWWRAAALRRHWVLLAAALPWPASAHSFGKTYSLPIPVSLYLWGAASALALSFLLIGYFVNKPSAADRNFGTLPAPWLDRLSSPRLRLALTILSVLLLILTLLTGWFGVTRPAENFSMVFFWIVIVLGYTYWVALAGDSYNAINPWRAWPDLCAWLWKGSFRGRFRYPARLGYLPALILYYAFIWFELFPHLRTYELASLLCGYLAISVLGAWLWGREAWFRYGDFFGVFFRIFGMLAPLERVDGKFRLRQPGIGLMRQPCESGSLLLFVLFMLSSTAFDGVHKTVPWVSIYWVEVLGLVRPIIGGTLVETFPLFKQWYPWFQSAALLLSPLLYLALYLLVIAMMKRMTQSPASVRTLALQFAFTLVPIAFVYHLSHYFTLLQTQGPLIIKVMSDPFGWGWNLLGTADWFSKPIIPKVGVVWHLQVALILMGHIASVYLSHLVAMRVFASPRQAVISQLPMLLLMMAYTASGLWILGQPIQGGVMVPLDY